ncbi:MAG: nucleoside-diphosphate sugar epimerase/dehydratase [Gammaproteobacteria bacterium]|nr:nucleoside-diphosphate sugar epimerase/dehydratase [Gammaproteobacteria bacterium]
MAGDSRFSIDRLRRPVVVFVHDLLMVPVAWLASYWLRFNLNEIPPEYLSRALGTIPALMVVQALAFYWSGMYRGVWRFASLPDLIRILKAVAVGAAISFGLFFLLFWLDKIPRSMVLLYPLLLSIFLSGPRFLYRWSKDRRLTLTTGKRVLIVGAGRAGEMLVRDLLRKQGHEYSPVAFVDDKPRRHGQDLHGVPVVGYCEEIPGLVERLDIEIIMLAVPSARATQLRHLVELCEKSGVPFQTVPALDALMSGQVSINELREVSIEDILGRDPVSLDWDAIREGLSGKTILVTGGGGSIGSELCRQIAALQPAQLILLENSEYNLYALDMELGQRFPAVQLTTCLGDVRDAAKVEQLFSEHRPDVVFHAAAYKHVPMLEHQLREAVYNNVQGTRNVALAADRHGCSEFVLISTDKAVNPANVMGATKRVAEIFCQNLDGQSQTRFITVRFGNVLDSAGSVVPLFREQIRAGGPVTVTHADMERYFMTIPEAALLILQSAVLGNGGEIFVLDMGEPVKIQYLAEQMIRLSGKEPDVDIVIICTGLRPGEKLYEELFHEQEKLEHTQHKKILLARHRKVDWDELTKVLDEVEAACAAVDAPRLLELVTGLVPENRIAPSGNPAS